MLILLSIQKKLCLVNLRVQRIQSLGQIAGLLKQGWLLQLMQGGVSKLPSRLL